MELKKLGGTSAALQAALAWANASPSCPDLVLTTGEAGDIGYFPGKDNESSIRFAPDGAEQAKGALAVTVTTYTKSTGSILDADIIVNGKYRFRKLVGEQEQKEDSPVAYDLQNTLTHEMGHLMGLGEDYEHTYATMYAYTEPGEVKKRILSAEDLSALQTLYENGEASDASGGGCGVSAAGAPASLPTWSAGLLLLGLGLTRRRRPRRASAAVALGVAAVSVALPSVADSARLDADLVFDADLRVASIDASFEDGIIVSELSLSSLRCSGDCARVPERVVVYGGEVGELVQIVGHEATPRAGQAVRLTLERGSLERFALTPLRGKQARSRTWQ